jgi:hypothetical protein
LPALFFLVNQLLLKISLAEAEQQLKLQFVKVRKTKKNRD